MTLAYPDSRMSDKARHARCCVLLTDFELEARIGAYPHERDLMQSLILDIEVEVTPPVIDSLEGTLDYDLIAGWARLLAQDHIALVETFAMRLAEACLTHPNAHRVEVKLRKLGAVRGASAGTRIALGNAAGTDLKFLREAHDQS